MTKSVDWEKVDNLLVCGSNATQVAAELGLSTDTLYKYCELEKKTHFSAYLQEKRAKGNAMIHAAQFHAAIKTKNPTMLIWLGKQRLGQKEVTEESTEAPKQAQIDKDHIIMTQAHRIAELEANGNKS